MTTEQNVTPTAESAPSGEASADVAVEATTEAGQQTAPEQAAPAAVPDPKIHELYADLQRRDRELRAKEKRLKTVESEVESKTALAKEIESAKANPLAWMEKGGFSYEQLTQFILDGEVKAPEPTEADRIAQLEQKLAAKEQAEKEAKEAAERQAIEADVKQKQAGIVSLLQSAGEEFDLVNANEEYDLVFDVMYKHYEQHQEPLDPRVAAARVEAYLEQQEKARIARSKKLPKFLQPSAPPAELRQNEASQETARPQPTLGRANQAEARPAPASTGRWSREESMANARRLLRDKTA